MRKKSIRDLLNRVLIIVSALFLLLPLLPLPASAAECTDRPEAVSFSFLNTGNTGNISSQCFFSDEYFYQPGTVVDSHLRTMSLAMSMSAFESYREGEDYTGRCENFERLMSRIGFFDFSHNDAYDEKPTEESIGIVLARKKIDVFGTEYDLIAVGIRGASYEAEWANNLRVGPSGQSEGFSSAKDQVLEYLSEYESARNITDHAKIWISGYSRAGAVSNLTAEALNLNPSDFATTTEDIYCYTFEAPQGEETAAAGQFRNIHNTVSPADPVPLIPLNEWGMTRVGYTQEGRIPCYSQDDCLLPAPGSAKYEAQIDTMLAHLYEINPDIDYRIDSFTEFRPDIWNSDNALPQSDFLLSFVSWLNSTIPDRSRASYAENYQEAFAVLGRIFPAAWASQPDEISAAFQAAVRDPLFYASVADAVLVIPLRFAISETEYRNAIKDASDKIAENLIGHLRDEDVHFTEEEYREIAEAIYPVVLFTDAALEDDFANYGGYHLATLLFNMKTFVQAHNPEVILAWMETLDSYYTPSLFTPHQLERARYTKATCTADGHKEFWKCALCGISYADANAEEKITEKDVLLPATGHDWDDGTVTKAATIKSNGIRVYTCRNCKKTHTESIAKLPSPSVKPEKTAAAQNSDLSITEPDPAATESKTDLFKARRKGILRLALTAAAILVIPAAFLSFRKRRKK